MKNRKQMEARRRQKTADRAKRAKAYTPPPKPKAKVQQADPMEALKSLWFLLHGFNYLSSDYSTGEWKPVFDVYADNFDILGVTAEYVQEHLASNHYDEPTQTWTPKGRLLLAWAGLSPDTMRGIRMALLGHLAQQFTVEQAAEELIKPHHPAVWAFFHDQIVSRLVQPEVAPAVEGGDTTNADGGQHPVEEAP